MRPLWIVGIVTVVVLMVASVASAALREELSVTAKSTVAVVKSVAAGLGPVATSPGADETVAPDPDETATPEPEKTATPEADETVAPEPDAAETAHPDNHGAAVSAVAGDKTALGTKALPNGKTITNHGQAVSAKAHEWKTGDGGGTAAAATHGKSGKRGGKGKQH